MRDCLPESLYNLIVATAIKPATRLVVLDEQLRQKFTVPLKHPPLPDHSGFGVNRLTLREILLADLADIVHFGKACSGFDQLENGLVRAYFSDGTTTSGNLLVGADGTSSVVRALIAPDARIDNLHYAIYGRTPCGPHTLEWVPEILIDSFNRITGPTGTAMAVATCRQVEAASETRAGYGPGHTQCTPGRQARGLFYHFWHRGREHHLGACIGTRHRRPA